MHQPSQRQISYAPVLGLNCRMSSFLIVTLGAVIPQSFDDIRFASETMLMAIVAPGRLSPSEKAILIRTLDEHSVQAIAKIVPSVVSLTELVEASNIIRKPAPAKVLSAEPLLKVGSRSDSNIGCKGGVEAGRQGSKASIFQILKCYNSLNISQTPLPMLLLLLLLLLQMCSEILEISIEIGCLLM